MQLFRQWRAPLKASVSSLIGLGAALSVGVGVSLFGSPKPVQAAEEIVFTYGPLGTSFRIDELEKFAQTGDVPSKWRFYFNVSGADPEVIQTILSNEFNVSLLFADEVLNTIPGEFALFSIGKIVHTRSRRANIQALRSAFVLSLADDDQISLIEFLKNHPLQQIYVDGVELAKVAKDVSRAVNTIEEVVQRLEAYWAIAKEFLGEFVDCECDPAADDIPDDLLDLQSQQIDLPSYLIARPDRIVVQE
jgi:hypothetical protein